MKEKTIEIVNVGINKNDRDYITLGSLLKFLNIIHSGGQAKSFLSSNFVLVNGMVENRRGRKVRVNDIIEFNQYVYKIES